VNRLILLLALLVSFPFSASPASAQGVTVYGVVQPEYRVGSFRLYPPTGDGWRQVTNEASVLRLVYAEVLDSGAIHTRADIMAEAFPIPSPDLVDSALRLALNGQSQQMEQYGDTLLGYTRVEKVDSKVETHAYTLKLRLTEAKTRYEIFFVALAPDKSEYLVVKFTIDEEGYLKQPFFEEFVKSFAKMNHPELADNAAAESGEVDSEDEPQAGESSSP
jgi:hypothetical protein